MTTYKYPELPEDYTTEFREIAEQELQILWQHDYWDGALSGMMMYKNKAHWFQLLVDDYENIVTDENGQEKREFVRRFMLLEVSEEQYQEELYWNELFREKVGTHWDYDDGKLNSKRFVKPHETHAEYYEAAEKRKFPDFSKNKIVGWFEW